MFTQEKHRRISQASLFNSEFWSRRYSMDESADGEALFIIDENSGLIKTTASLDREGVAWHNVTVSAAEVGK